MNKHMDKLKALKAQSVSAFSDFKREVHSSLFLSTLTLRWSWELCKYWDDMRREYLEKIITNICTLRKWELIYWTACMTNVSSHSYIGTEKEEKMNVIETWLKVKIRNVHRRVGLWNWHTGANYHQVDIFEEKFSAAVNEDKAQDKNFRKHFSDCGDVVNLLYKKFKDRPK